MSFSEFLAQKIPAKVKSNLRMALCASRVAYGRTLVFSPHSRYKANKFKKISQLKLNIGCGKVKLPGWVNIDIEHGADLVIDARKGLPFCDESVDFIYNEHFLEHLSYEEGEKVLREFFRCLKKGCVLRVAMPDLDYLIHQYNKEYWSKQDWLTWPGHEFINTKGRMINVSFYWWGHKYLYNEEDLRDQLNKAGFLEAVRCEWNKSEYIELSDLETRKDSKLIMEAKKL